MDRQSNEMGSGKAVPAEILGEEGAECRGSWQHRGASEAPGFNLLACRGRLKQINVRGRIEGIALSNVGYLRLGKIFRPMGEVCEVICTVPAASHQSGRLCVVLPLCAPRSCVPCDDCRATQSICTPRCLSRAI